ncbi:hypothetical protein [Pseudomonas citronellolis]|uniref:hypothetical protein n=1 Tax=Pseudomonas citronellolis TaxID=53408 RepID=UPI00248E085B|nr:hypothetical protein [Pseudomonas citronellolis]
MLIIYRIRRLLTLQQFNWLDLVGLTALLAPLGSSWWGVGLGAWAMLLISSIALSRPTRRIFCHWTDSNGIESWFEDRGTHLIAQARKRSPVLPDGRLLEMAVRVPREMTLFASGAPICPEDQHMVELKRRLLETEQRIAEAGPEAYSEEEA